MSNALGVTYGVGLDGSRMSYQALDIVLSLARKSDGNDATRCDKVVCIHVPSEQNQGTEVIKGEADARCTKLGPDMFNWKVERKQPGDTTTKALLYAAQKEGVSYLVLGVYGRKGEANLLSGECQGSSAAAMIQSCAWATSILVKPTSPLPTDSKKFLLLTDFSPAAKIAFERLLAELASPKDKVWVLHVTRHKSFAQRITEWHEERLAAAGMPVKDMVIIEDNGQVGLAEFACSVSDRVTADFLVLGWQGHANTSGAIGSFASEIKQLSFASVIMYKDQG